MTQIYTKAIEEQFHDTTEELRRFVMEKVQNGMNSIVQLVESSSSLPAREPSTGESELNPLGKTAEQGVLVRPKFGIEVSTAVNGEDDGGDEDNGGANKDYENSGEEDQDELDYKYCPHTKEKVPYPDPLCEGCQVNFEHDQIFELDQMLAFLGSSMS